MRETLKKQIAELRPPKLDTTAMSIKTALNNREKQSRKKEYSMWDVMVLNDQLNY